jgi:hypothetical protein
MPSTLDEIKAIVDSGELDRFVGKIEDQFFDAKGQPYQFDAGMDAKREFAKDVTSFANAAGGWILVGLSTVPSLLAPGEQVDVLRPLARTLFNVDQHRKIVLEWVYPVPKDIEIRWMPWGVDVDKGVGAIFIPPQNERLKPFLITRTIGDKKSTEVVVGYVERRLDATEVRSVVELHHALRLGFNFERELLGRIENIELAIERNFSAAQTVQTAEATRQLFKQRIGRLFDSLDEREPPQR